MASAQQLKETLIKLFPECNILSNVRKNSKIVSPVTGNFLELDFVVVGQKLSFEYQDPSHYVTTNLQRTLTDIKQADTAKRNIVDDRGDTLISVPFWWDGTIDSLVTSIRTVRPDLLKSYVLRRAVPIPLSQPSPQVPQVLPTVGELMLPSFASYTEVNAKFWWVSEKYDGVRVCWHPEEAILYTRFAKEFHVPQFFVKCFPEMFIDGEIWLGRENYEEIQGDHRFSDQSWNFWSFVRLLAFDCPSPELQPFEFEIRARSITMGLPPAHPFLIETPQLICTGFRHLRHLMQLMEQSQGEGLVARKPKMEYEQGRTNSMLKFKIHRDDEAVVAALEHPHVTLLLPGGQSFVATSVLSGRDLKIGDVVSFISNGLSTLGLPINAKITRIRHEFSALDFLAMRSKGSMRLPQAESDRNQKGYWTREEGKEIHSYLLDFAHRRGFDPFVAENWYNITTSDIRKDGGGGILNHFSGSIVTALLHSFPSIGLDRSKFKLHPKFYWHVYQNRKQFFEELAAEHRIDSSKASSWYRLTVAMLANKKGGTTLLQQFGSMERLLKDVYPNLNLDATKFNTIPHYHWNDIGNQRAFFDKFAKKQNFDPLIARNWYKIAKTDLQYEKGAAGILNMFGGSLVRAVSHVYPDIGIDIAKFSNLPNNFWKEYTNRRQFFVAFAKKKKFDPTDKQNWTAVTQREILREKGGLSILRFYGSSLRSALADVFP